MSKYTGNVTEIFIVDALQVERGHEKRLPQFFPFRLLFSQIPPKIPSKVSSKPLSSLSLVFDT